MFSAIRSFMARGGASGVSSHFYPSRGVRNFSRGRLVVTGKRTKWKFNSEQLRSSNAKLTHALTELATAQKSSNAKLIDALTELATAQKSSNAKLTDALTELATAQKDCGQMLGRAQMFLLGVISGRFLLN